LRIRLRPAIQIRSHFAGIRHTHNFQASRNRPLRS
jgi:hypothetical protein